MRALIAMSGGVDSTVAALLMQQQGYDCVGVTLRLWGDDTQNEVEARSVAEQLDIPHIVLDRHDMFDQHVVRRFADAYLRGETPNPCVDCNRFIKFGALLAYAHAHGFDCVATGHYAITEQTALGYALRKAADLHKDQSYVLYTLTQEMLAKVRFPLGPLSKTGVRALASQHHFANAQKPESQDICFVSDGDYAGFIERYTGHTCPPGDFIDTQGQILGRHRGLIRYTVGQRKGLGLPLQTPMYVCEKNASVNTVTLCDHDGLMTAALTADDFNWIIPHDNRRLRIKAKTRYRQTEQWAVASQTAAGTVHITFDAPQRAITPGQAVVLYDGDFVVGGGRIV